MTMLRYILERLDETEIEKTRYFQRASRNVFFVDIKLNLNTHI